MVFPISSSPFPHPLYFTTFGLISQCVFLSTYQLRKVFDLVATRKGAANPESPSDTSHFTTMILAYSLSSALAAVVFTLVTQKKLVKRRYGIYSALSLMLLFYVLLILVVSGAIPVCQRAIVVVSSLGLGQVDFTLSSYACEASVVKPSQDYGISKDRASTLTLLHMKYLSVGAAVSLLLSALFVALVDVYKKDLSIVDYFRRVSRLDSLDGSEVDGVAMRLVTEAYDRSNKYIVGYAAFTLSLIVLFLLYSVAKFSLTPRPDDDEPVWLGGHSLSVYRPQQSDDHRKVAISIRPYTMTLLVNSMVNTFCLLNLYKVWRNGLIPVPVANVYYGVMNLGITILVALVVPRLYSSMSLNQMYIGSLCNVLLVPAMATTYKYKVLYLKGDSSLLSTLLGNRVTSFVLINVYIGLNGILNLVPRLQCISFTEPRNRKIAYRYILFASTLGMLVGSIVNTLRS